jgi:hypothetical protein
MKTSQPKIHVHSLKVKVSHQNIDDFLSDLKVKLQEAAKVKVNSHFNKKSVFSNITFGVSRKGNIYLRGSLTKSYCYVYSYAYGVKLPTQRGKLDVSEVKSGDILHIHSKKLPVLQIEDCPKYEQIDFTVGT